MSWLLLGLVLFLGSHSVRIFAEGWRTQTRAKVGEGAWKGIYSLVSILGFGLIVWGFGQARLEPVVLWVPPTPMRHIAALLVLFAFVLLAGAYVPGNAIKAKLHHPMILSVKVWALAHLLANGRLADVVLFGAFLLWAILDFRASRQRDRRLGTRYAAGSALPTVITVIVGAAAWAGFAFWAHLHWIGLAPLGVSA
jgi:uncharacterized membrane protein